MLPYRRNVVRDKQRTVHIDMYEIRFSIHSVLKVQIMSVEEFTQLKILMSMRASLLTWQTYDIQFTNAVQGNKIKNARIIAHLNGPTITII